VDGRAESPGETELRLVLVDAGITGFQLNLVVRIPASGRVRRLDIAFEREKVALEYQGLVHLDPRRWRDDMTRVSQLESLGWMVVFVNAADLANPVELVDRIRRILESRRP
jgi:very-short-patch-repair endonuclease